MLILRCNLTSILEYKGSSYFLRLLTILVLFSMAVFFTNVVGLRFVNVFVDILLLISYFGYTLKGDLSLHATLTFYNFNRDDNIDEVDSFDKRTSGDFLLRFMLILFFRRTRFSCRVLDLSMSLFQSFSICSRYFLTFGEGYLNCCYYICGSSIVIFSSLDVLRNAILFDGNFMDGPYTICETGNSSCLFSDASRDWVG